MVLWFFKFNGIVRIRAPRLELVVSCGLCDRKSLELNLKRTFFTQQTESLKLGNITCVTSSVLAGAYSITWLVKKNRERPQIFEDYNIIIIVMDMVITIIFNVIAIVIVVVYVNVDLTVIIIVIITLFSTSVLILNSIRGCYEIQKTSCFEAQVTSKKNGHWKQKLIMKTSILNKSFQQFSSIFLAVKQDCVVSPWSDWGPCSPRCGIGFRRRTRTVTFRPMNGGRECPPLIENSGCFTKLCGGKELGKEASRISSFFMLCLLLGKHENQPYNVNRQGLVGFCNIFIF